MIYLDYAATAPMSEQAAKTYIDIQNSLYANPNSTHAFGRQASRKLEECRGRVLRALKLDKTHNLIFTSTASESNSMALKSIALRYKSRGKRIVSCLSEHPSVLQSLKQLEKEFGFEVILLPADDQGHVSVAKLKEVVNKSTILVSIMACNNETGAISPIKEIGLFLQGFPKCLFHVDATQAIGKEEIDYSLVDLLSFSAHKFEGPKGVGFLAYRSNLNFLPLISGGSQEFGVRGGTVNLPGIVSSTIALENILLVKSKRANIQSYYDKIKAFVLENPAELVLNSPESGSPYVINFSFTHLKASVILEALSEKGIYVSSVSACSSKAEPVSEVLLAMGKSRTLAKNSLRVSFSIRTKENEVNAFLTELGKIMKEVRPR